MQFVKIMNPRGVICVLLGLLGITGAVGAAVWIVHPDGSGPYPTIQSAADAAANGDVIELTNGTFQGVGNRDVDFLGKGLSLRSQGGNPDLCAVDLDGYPIGHGPGGGLHVENTTFRGGRSMTGYQTELNFVGCVFEGASGVASVLYGAIRCSHCTFRGGVGGFLSVGENGTLAISDCSFSGVHGVSILETSYVDAVSCDFSDNELTGDLIHLVTSFFPPTASFEGCRFERNAVGGAVIGTGGWELGSLHVDGCTLAANRGPGIAVSGSPSGLYVDIQRSTFAANETAGSAEIQFALGNASQSFVTIDKTIIAFTDGGMAVDCGNAETPALTCCDLYGNTGGDWVGCIANQAGVNGNRNLDPLFCGELNGNPWTLRNDSPCLLGACGRIGAWGFGCSVASAPDEIMGGACLIASPNPFHGTVRLAGRLPVKDPCVLQIFDPAGRIVSTSPLIPADGGVSATWDGTDRLGRRLPSGVYLYRVTGTWGSGRISLVR